MKKISRLAALKQNEGFSEMVGTVLALLVATILILTLITVGGVLQQRSTLHRIGNTILTCAADIGNMDAESGKLESQIKKAIETMNLDPERLSYQFSCDGEYDPATKNVQQGELIRLDIMYIAYLNNPIGEPLEVKLEFSKTERSQVFWKDM